MAYLAQFHWWYLIVGVIVLFVLFGKSKGGVVVRKLSADLTILDSRFEGCRPEADYKIFKADGPEHLDIVLRQLELPVGAELEIQLNGRRLGAARVKGNRKAKFDPWSDELDFPTIQAGDELLISYQGIVAMSGVFRLD